MTQPPGGRPGHPEPEPMPTPEPDPPMPIPPPEPTPAPEPPHESGLSAAGPASPAADAASSSADTASSSADTASSSADTASSPAGAASSPADPDDFIDAPPTADVQWPPFGAFDDERLASGGREPGDEQLTEPVPLASSRRQPPPTQPWHAQHEKPGEWHTTPPEHLAFHHSPPAEVQEPVTEPVTEIREPATELREPLTAFREPTTEIREPTTDFREPTTEIREPTTQVREPVTEIVRTVPPPPWQVPLKPDADDRRRKTGLWLSVALTTTLLLCGGGAFSAYLLLRDADGGGAPDPATAVNEFMTAVYTRQDAAAANELVCREARDSDRLAARVSQIKGLANEYDGPTFRWNEPSVSGQTDDRATVSVQLTLSTDDEKTAEQQLTFTTVHKTGWQVCEIAG